MLRSYEKTEYFFKLVQQSCSKYFPECHCFVFSPRRVRGGHTCSKLKYCGIKFDSTIHVALVINIRKNTWSICIYVVLCVHVFEGCGTLFFIVALPYYSRRKWMTFRIIVHISSGHTRHCYSNS